MPEALVKDPIYFQAAERLRGLIVSGAFVPGEKFLTERQVAERFSISRATANKVLAGLVADGSLEFRKGVGTFVREAQKLDYDLRALVSFTEKARAVGKTPETRVLTLERLPAHPTFAPGEALWMLERLRLANGIPVIRESRLLVQRHCPQLTAELATGSLYAYLTDTLGLAVAGADEVIQAVGADSRDAALLEVDAGTPCLCITATAALVSGEPLWWERTLYRGDAYELRHQLGPITHAARGVLK
jgi:GntR family transcriptional regulator